MEKVTVIEWAQVAYDLTIFSAFGSEKGPFEH